MVLAPGACVQIVLLPHLDIRDDEQIKRAISRSNVVVNCVGMRLETMNWSFEDVHVEFPKRLAKWVMRTPFGLRPQRNGGRLGRGQSVDGTVGDGTVRALFARLAKGKAPQRTCAAACRRSLPSPTLAAASQCMNITALYKPRWSPS